MKFRALSIGIAVLLAVFAIPMAMFVAANILPAQKEDLKAGDYRISGPYTHENLTIFLVHGKDTLTGKKFLTLQEAMERKVVIVHETRDVNELAIENLSSGEEIFVQAGGIVKGGEQGRVRSQIEVWAGVESAQEKLSASTNANVRSAVSRSSYQLTLENEKVQGTAE